MKTTSNLCQRLLQSSAGLFVLIALIITAGVIPAVKADTFPLGTPERAAIAFWFMVGINLLAATVMAVMGTRNNIPSRIMTIVLGLMTVVTLLCAIAFTDAGFAFQSHGPAMQFATLLIFFCLVIDLIIVGLVIAVMFLFHKKI